MISGFGYEPGVGRSQQGWTVWRSTSQVNRTSFGDRVQLIRSVYGDNVRRA
jgi:hypothetical protein